MSVSYLLRHTGHNQSHTNNGFFKLVEAVVQKAGMQAHSQKFWSVKNPSKIHENLWKCSQNTRKF